MTKCVMCDHPRQQHSINGCTHSGKTKEENCTCTVRYTDKEYFK